MSKKSIMLNESVMKFANRSYNLRPKKPIIDFISSLLGNVPNVVNQRMETIKVSKDGKKVSMTFEFYYEESK